MPTPGKVLQSGITALGQDPTSHPQDKYFAYLDLLQRWNKAYNLTGIREPERMLTHHILDSLAVLPHIQGVRCLDVGTGAGMPGLILALARPDTHWTLLDSNGKKIRFLNQCQRELGINNVEVAQARIEAYEPAAPFDTITSRAFASLPEFWQVTNRLLSPHGQLLAMKGPNPESEADTALTDKVQVEAIRLQVPGVEGERTVVKMRLKPE